MARAHGLPVVAFAALLPMVFWPPFEDAFKLPQHALLLVFAGWLVGVSRPVVADLARRPEVPGLLALIWMSAAAGPETARAGDLATGTALAVIGWLLPGWLRAARDARVLPALAAAGAASAAYSLWQFIVGDPAGGVATRGLRPFSTMGNPDFLAAFLVAVFPWQVAAWLRTGTSRWGACAALTGAALLIAQSRGAWLALVGAGLAAPILVRITGGRVPWTRRMTAGGAITLLAVAGYLAGHAEGRGRLLAMFRTGHFDAAGRFAMWRESAAMTVDRPLLGHGPGAYGRMHPGYHARAMGRDPVLPWFYSENAHNDPLQIAAETGVLGLGAALWWIIALVRLGWIAHRRGDADGLPVLLGVIGIGINALVNFPWYLLPALGWAWLAYSVLAARHGPGEPEGRDLARWPGAVRLAILLVIGTAAGRMLVANGWLKLAGDFSAAGRWPESLACAGRADARWLGWEGRGRVAAQAAAAAYGVGDFAAAERWSIRALEREPSAPAHHNQLGLALARQGKIREAEDAVRAALALNPRMGEAWHTLGNLAWLQGDRAGAATAWRTALSLNPALEGVRQSLGALEAAGTVRPPPRKARRGGT